MPEKDLYKILGVSENADTAEIKKRYRELAKKYHPDKNKGDQAAEAKFKEVSEAADILTDPEKRKQYDQMRKYAGAGFGAGGFDPRDFRGGFTGRRTRGAGGFGGGDPLGGFGGFGDIFSQIFGQGMGGAQQSSNIPRKGQDIHGSINITFDEAIKGTKKTISITGTQPCATCGGTGAEPSSKTTTCPECGGTGQISTSMGGFAINRTCPRCIGRGTIIGAPCRTCGGSGTTKGTRKISVTIPAGVEHNQQLRLAGQGSPGSGGAPAGDLIVTVHVGADPHFKRRGKNIHSTERINLAEALLGTSIKVRTLNGRASLKVPAGTKSGTVLRMKKLGAQQNATRGDHLVTIDVEMPRNLTAEEKELVKKFAQSRGWDIGGEGR